MNTEHHRAGWLRRHIELHAHETPAEERANAATHAFGALTALAYLLWVPLRYSGSKMLYPLLIHALSLLFLYLCSTIYHRLPISDTKRLFRLLDHMAIYILIAGTYTPVLARLELSTSRLLLIVIWAFAGLGMLFSVVFWGRLKILHVAVYLAMGWFIVPVWALVAPAVPAGLTPWLFCAGLSYTLGVIWYSRKSLQYGHAVWHIACVVAGLLFCIGFSLHFVP